MTQRPAGTRPATRDDVARLSGVSSAVVSYVVNDGPRPVAAHTRQRVLEAMRELGYRPNAAARAFRLQKTHMLGLLVPDISNPFFGEFAKAVQIASSPRGYALMFADTENSTAKEAEQIQFLADRQPDGVMAIARTKQTDISPLLSRGIPVVAFDRFEGDGLLPTVTIDNYLGARDGVAHLQGHGHTKVALLAGPQDTQAGHARMRGWRDVAGTGADSASLHVTGDFSREAGYSAMRELLDRGVDFTALFVSSDIQAIGALRALAESGLDVPRDLAVVAFDGTRETEYSHPPLTVVRQPLELLAETALDLLLDPENAQGIHQVVPHELVLRSSCGC